MSTYVFSLFICLFNERQHICITYFLFFLFYCKYSAPRSNKKPEREKKRIEKGIVQTKKTTINIKKPFEISIELEKKLSTKTESEIPSQINFHLCFKRKK